MDNSPFGRLPPEIRLMIYKEVLLEDDAIMVTNVYGKAYIRGDDTYAAPRTLLDAINLRGTCRLMRDENSGLYFSSNDVAIDAWGPNFKRGSSSVRQQAHFEEGCADFIGWAHWFGRSVLRPRSITLSLGGATDVTALEWQKIETAVYQFPREVTIYLWIPVIRQRDLVDVFGTPWERYSDFKFKFGGKESAFQAVDRLLVWYNNERKKYPGVLSQCRVEEIGKDMKLWAQKMPNRR